MNSLLDRWSPFLLPTAILGGGVLFGWAIAAMLPPSSTPFVDDGVVVRVCHDGTLVLRKGETWLVVRPGAWRGWPAASDKVCERND